ncbi:TerB family tellurite resistance protein [Shewanella sp. SG41-4]|jgi:tellurite resistance protein|uniref:TerB family tellurite resistance protein n=1 Tax=Shewanella sp. SG41-4 TaxID=2760976 RepID=UPI0016033422|nr:TerB family tellurite resistance protein [Shewanella sp. SG41-4]MBB1441443.1 TerB family tellurite resistance protein [Shewanella sp. SG41-4]
MYLSELNIGEKKNFLELAKYAMGLNGEYKPEEQMVYQSFIQECCLAEYQISKQDNIDVVMKVLAKSTEKSKRIVMLELFGILLADGEVSKEESDFMEEFAEILSVESYESKKIQRWVIAMNDMVSEGYAMVNKE